MIALPSIDMAVETVDVDMSDASSLSDARSLIMDFDEEDASSPYSDFSPMRGDFDKMDMSPRFVGGDDDDMEKSGKPIEPSPFIADIEADGDEESEEEVIVTHTSSTRRRTLSEPRCALAGRISVEATNAQLGPLEMIPLEILEKLATYLSDSDLYNLILSGKSLSIRLMPENSGIWKVRFLSLYDYPILERPYDFCTAYRLRRYVLRKFPGCGDDGPRAEVGMEVLRDMVLETYNKAESWLPVPTHSRNLATFSAGSTSPWMTLFLKSSFFADNQDQYGKPNDLFDALQLIFSHLVLNPISAFAISIATSREDYDIAKIYLWNKPFETIFRRDHKTEAEQSARASRNPSLSHFPKLRSPESEPEMLLDLHTLLHLRNFWRRHLTESDNNGNGENTYWNMTQGLVKLGKIPKRWARALNEPLVLETNWVGHYSCIYNWPKKAEVLKEVQSCAQDWNNTSIDSLTLDFSIVTSDTLGKYPGYWPPIFSTIPAFANTTPPRSGAPYHCIRGIAPFLDLSWPSADYKGPERKKYHPFTSLRLRGLIHTIPVPQAASHPDEGLQDWEVDQGIPGWNRITMVLYKPATIHLTNIFQYASEEYGDPLHQIITTQMVQDGATTLDASGQIIFDPAEIEKRRVAELNRKVRDFEGPVQMDRKWMEMVEDMYSNPAELHWDDIESAYAYEGVIIPGGKIMMGRWWMVHANGEGEGMEMGGAEKGERGPWVFWC